MGRLVRAVALTAGLAAGLAAASAGVSEDPGLAAPAVHAGGAGGAGAAVAGAGGAIALPGRPRPVLLINGDQLLAGATPGGGFSHTLLAGATGGVGAALMTMRLGGRTYVVPADALPYLGRGLSASLFDLGSLLRDGAGGCLPVEVRYAGRVPSLPGIPLTSASRGTAHGYLTAASARTFGAALARQFAADHARGSYGRDGLFAGGVSVSLPGAAAPGAGGRRFPMETLTVTGTTLAGEPDTGDEVLVFNADDSRRFADPVESGNFFDNGVAKFSVPAGHYWAVGLFSQSSGSHPAVRVVVLPQFTVRGATTVPMAERAASSRVTMVVPRPALTDYTFFMVIRSGASGPPVATSLDAFGSLPVWVSPTSRKPTVGGLRAFTASQLDSPAGAAGTPYEYGLAYLATSGLIPPQRHVVDTARLAHVRAGYYQAVPAPVQQFMTVGTKQTHVLLGGAYGLGVIFHAPSRINEYLSAGRSLIWNDQYFQQAAVFTGGGGQADPGKSFTPGERVTEDWGAFPLHVAPDVNLVGARNPAPLVVSASRTGDYLGIYVTPFSDNVLGNVGSGWAPIPDVKFSGRYEIDVNGARIASGSVIPPRPAYAIAFGRALRVTPKPSVVRLLLTAQRTGSAFPLSSASRTVWTWRSSHEAGSTVPPGWVCLSAVAFKLPARSCAAEAMMTLRYAVAGLSLAGSTPAGRQVLHVIAGHLQLVRAIPVTGLSVSVSFDGGKTWHPATVTGHGGSYTATFTAPAGAKVSLRTSAADAAGGSVSETLTNAYQTSP
jgi:hypothetical protein